jgi:hypothetical protein
VFIWMASLQPERGKRGEALVWAKEYAAAINAGVSPIRPAEVLVEVFGEHGRIYMAGGYRDWDHIQRWRDWASTNEVAVALLNRGNEAGLFVAGSRRDTLLETG